MIRELPGKAVDPKRVLISWWRIILILLIKIVLRLGTNQNIGDIKNTSDVVLIQFGNREIEEAGSNTENRLFIIFKKRGCLIVQLPKVVQHLIWGDYQ
jgi:hypothetical protein